MNVEKEDPRTLEGSQYRWITKIKRSLAAMATSETRNIGVRK